MHVPRAPRPDIVRFGEFDLDLQSGEIRRGGCRLVLAEQPFRILALLVRRHGELVTRDDLRCELWPADTFVDFEHGLNAAIKRLREVLGDSATNPAFIETIPRRGYRFIAPLVEPLAIAARRIEPAVRRPARTITSYIPRVAVIVVVVAVIAGAVDKMVIPVATRPVTWVTTKLTFTSGVNVDPAISPDGALVAYASDRAGSRSSIWLQPAAGGDAIRLTSDAADDEEPSFAPDGRQIVFSRRDTGVLIIGTLGGATRIIAREAWARTPRISPDGTMVAYWTGFPASALAGGIPGAPGALHVVPIDGGLSRTIPVRIASARYPIWSPDGTRLLFLGDEDTDAKRFDWYVTDLSGSTLAKTEAVDAIRQAGLQSGPPIPSGWTGPRGTVMFATNESATSSVWCVGISLAGRVTSAPERLTYGTASERSPSAATSGRVALASVRESVAVYRVPLDGVTGLAAGSVERVTDAGANARLRAVSMDGRWLAFVSARTSRDEVWIRDLQTGSERQVTFSGSDGATLSPDGSRVIVNGSDTAGRGRLDVVSPAANTRLDLCLDCASPQDWSPDGDRVLVEAGRPTGLVLVDIATHVRRALAAHATWSLDMARFSPDGRWIAFQTATSPNSRHVYVVPSGGTSIPQSEWVPVVTDHGCHPSWSADGARIYHFSFRDGEFCPWVQRVDAETKRPLGAPSPVLHLHASRLRAATGALATNIVRGGYLYFTATEMSSEVFLLDPQRR